MHKNPHPGTPDEQPDTRPGQDPERQIRRLRAVHRMSEIVASAVDLHTIHEAGIEALVDALGLDRASVLLFDPDGVMRFKAWRGLSDAYREAVSGHSPWKQGDIGAAPILVTDINKDASLAAFRETITREGITALAFIPLVGPSGLLGKFMLYCDEPHEFKDEEIQLAETIAHQIAFAIERTRARHEMETLLEKERATRIYVERVNRLKDEFLATLSHELRTPLQAILGWSRLLLTERLDDDQVNRAAEIIERNASIQARLIDDLLDMSRIISGKISLNVRKLSLAETIAASLETVSQAAEAKNIELTADLEPGLPPVLGDQERLQQVAWNLLSNAIKFTPRSGRIHVTLRRDGDYIEFAIEDSGQGIPGEFLPYVFERFLQADASTTRKQGGLGLGLAIVRNLVELHGGLVRAESPGHGLGATFRVHLPIPVRAIDRTHGGEGSSPKNGRRTTKKDHDLAGHRILVIDDEKDARELVRFVLEDSGAEVCAAASVAEALALLDGWKPDLIVSDIAMPGEDGFDFIRRLRSLPPESGGSIPAAALTALARHDDRLRVLECGFQLHMAKPIEPGRLVETVARLIGAERG